MCASGGGCGAERGAGGGQIARDGKLEIGRKGRVQIAWIGRCGVEGGAVEQVAVGNGGPCLPRIGRMFNHNIGRKLHAPFRQSRRVGGRQAKIARERQNVGNVNRCDVDVARIFDV